jgi:hypothetical protein
LEGRHHDEEQRLLYVYLDGHLCLKPISLDFVPYKIEKFEISGDIFLTLGGND